MSAFPVQNPNAPLAGKHALLQKLMSQYAQKRPGGMRPPGGPGQFGSPGIGGSPFHVGGSRNPISRLGITSGTGMNGQYGDQGALVPHPLQGEASGYPGQGVDPQQVSQIPGILQQMGQGQGTPGGVPPTSDMSSGGTAPPIGAPQTGMGQAPAQGMMLPEAADPHATGDWSYGQSWVPQGGGTVYDPITGKMIAGDSSGIGSQAMPMFGRAGRTFLS